MTWQLFKVRLVEMKKKLKKPGVLLKESDEEPNFLFHTFNFERQTLLGAPHRSRSVRWRVLKVLYVLEVLEAFGGSWCVYDDCLEGVVHKARGFP